MGGPPVLESHQLEPKRVYRRAVDVPSKVAVTNTGYKSDVSAPNDPIKASRLVLWYSDVLRHDGTIWGAPIVCDGVTGGVTGGVDWWLLSKVCECQCWGGRHASGYGKGRSGSRCVTLSKGRVSGLWELRGVYNTPLKVFL